MIALIEGLSDGGKTPRQKLSDRIVSDVYNEIQFLREGSEPENDTREHISILRDFAWVPTARAVAQKCPWRLNSLSCQSRDLWFERDSHRWHDKLTFSLASYVGRAWCDRLIGPALCYLFVYILYACALDHQPSYASPIACDGVLFDSVEYLGGFLRVVIR